MTASRKTLCLVYALIALGALVGTWGNNLAYLHLGFVGATAQFWQDTLVNAASRSITVDLFFLGVAVLVWMLLEARRLHMRGVWWYLVFGMLIAISVTFPLFMIQRERALAAQAPASDGGTLSASDLLGFSVFVLGTLGYTAVTLLR